MELDHDPARAEDDGYVDHKYHEVEHAIQEGMDALARKRALPALRVTKPVKAFAE